MEIYKIKTKKQIDKKYPTGQTFWTLQLPEIDSGDEVLGSQTLTEELLSEIPSIDKTYIILELMQRVRQDNVEAKAKEVALRTEKLKIKAKKDKK